LSPNRYTAANKAINHAFVQENFLTPKRVVWFDKRNRKAIAVGVGHCHLLVAACDEGSTETKVFASGLNDHGQLGLGDRVDRSVLTPVRSVSPALSSLFRLAHCVQ
jgi:alpha-tubulin suppressor-like RCC1 family protein